MKQDAKDTLLNALSQYLAVCIDTNCKQVISWAVVVFISLATMITKSTVALKLKIFFDKPETKCDNKIAESMIDAQIKIILEALNALPSKFPNS